MAVCVTANYPKRPLSERTQIALKEYRVSLATQRRYAWYYIPFVLILVAVLLLLPSLSEEPSAWPWILSLTLNFIVVPHVVLHLRYLRLSRGQAIVFDSARRAVLFRGPDGEIWIKDEDIQEIQITLSPTLKSGALVWFPWQEYCYAVVVLRSGGRLLITCLTVPGLRWPYEFPEATVLRSLLLLAPQH